MDNTQRDVEFLTSDVPLKPYFNQDGIVIYNADCRRVLPFLETFDLVLTDPPYGINADNQRRILSRGRIAKPKDYGASNWDDSPPEQFVIDAIVNAGNNVVIWGGNYFQLPRNSCWFVFDKDNGANDFADCELAWTNLDKAVRKFRYRWNGMLQEKSGSRKELRTHPTQKPLALMRWCLGHVPNDITILDPYMGSGTSLLAAKLEGRQAVGIEISERYCESAAKRLEQQLLF